MLTACVESGGVKQGKDLRQYSIRFCVASFVLDFVALAAVKHNKTWTIRSNEVKRISWNSFHTVYHTGVALGLNIYLLQNGSVEIFAIVN